MVTYHSGDKRQFRGEGHSLFHSYADSAEFFDTGDAEIGDSDSDGEEGTEVSPWGGRLVKPDDDVRVEVIDGPQLNSYSV